MTEKPILFSAPMVRSLLSGAKTQTRRVLKPQPVAGQYAATYGTAKVDWQVRSKFGNVISNEKFRWAPGDTLWCRETLTVNGYGLEYAADGELCHDLFSADANAEAATELWNRRAHVDGADVHPTSVPSIYMPRWASRITLAVTGVRVERLQSISEADAMAEGIYWSEDFEGFCSGRGPDETVDFHQTNPIRSYEKFWDAISGNSWDANPWVAVIEFRRMEDKQP